MREVSNEFLTFEMYYYYYLIISLCPLLWWRHNVITLTIIVEYLCDVTMSSCVYRKLMSIIAASSNYYMFFSYQFVNQINKRCLKDKAMQNNSVDTDSPSHTNLHFIRIISQYTLYDNFFHQLATSHLDLQAIPQSM